MYHYYGEWYPCGMQDDALRCEIQNEGCHGRYEDERVLRPALKLKLVAVRVF